MTQHDPSKRRFIKAATYVAPAILTLKVTPTFASGGSGRGNGNPAPPGEEPTHGGGVSDAGGSDAGAGHTAGGGSSAAAYSNSRMKKKRNWYWPFN